MSDDKEMKSKGYEVDPKLKYAAEVAVHLNMPLLLTGEPGTGKTLFAHYMAEQYFGRQLELHEFVSHTDSNYKDLLYKYDAIRHFRKEEDPKDLKFKQFEREYVSYQALGNAIKANERSVVLIDEIDKAPRDFPNDLLVALDQWKFKVEDYKGSNEDDEKSNEDNKELNGEYKYTNKEKPVVIITSNSEKELPAAFLRRVIYHHINFPKPDLLNKILTAQIYKKDKKTPPENLKKVFYAIRNELDLSKKPATAEFVSWVTYLKDNGLDFWFDDTQKRDKEKLEILRASAAILGKSQKDLDKIESRLTNL